MIWDEGPRTALCSDQRVFALKRKADLRIEMLKQVQHDGIPDEEPFFDDFLFLCLQLGTDNLQLLFEGPVHD